MARVWYFIVLLILSEGFLRPLPAQIVVINEVCTSPAAGPSGNSINANSLYNTNGTEQPPENREWIELYNPHPCNSVDISCYTLGSNMLQPSSPDDMPNWGAFTFPANTIIPPLGFIIVGGNNSQVPLLDFNLNYYRQNTFGTQYLDGDEYRWFLRDEYGWIALYDPSGTPVDAVYWDAYGFSANLFSQVEYSLDVITSTTCSGTQTLSAARNISGIEYVGACLPGTDVSFQRIMDGGLAWNSGPITATPRNCNGPCVVPPVITAVVQNETCAGNDGSIAITIQDGHSGPYTTNWIQPTGIHINTLSNLSSGTYIVQVVDAYNCFIVYDTIEVTAIPEPSITFNIVNESCNLSNGSIQAVIANGNEPINYQWNNPGIGNTAVANNLTAGTYSLTITDNLGCTASNTVTLQNFSGPGITIDSVHNEMCSAADGAAIVSINGGTPPFTFLWNSSPAQNGQNLTGVNAGTYTVTITDAYSCTATVSAIITDTPPPTVYFSNIQSDTCRKQTGAAYLTAYGGHPPYSFQWSCDTANTGTCVTLLSEGTYYVSVTDSFCTKIIPFTIPLIPGPKADFKFYPPIATIDKPDFRFEDWSTGIIDNWDWDFGDNDGSYLKDPTHSYNAVGNYDVTLTISNTFGCIDSITKTAIVIDRITLFVPNCFTPNGDGVNDYFFVLSMNITDYELFLYTRWGELIYHSTDVNEAWNGRYKGTVVPEGVYSWLINYTEDWAGFLHIAKTTKGILTVVR